MPQIGKGEAELLLPVEGGGAAVPGFGEIRRMVDQGREMADGGLHLPGLKGILAAGQQQIHRRRTGAAPDERDLALYLLGVGRIGLMQLLQ